MSPYFYLLDLPPPLRSDFVLPTSLENEEIFFYHPSEILNDNILKILRDLKLFGRQVLIFYSKPGKSQMVHIDRHEEIFQFGINWIFCNDLCSMSWYEVNGNGNKIVTDIGKVDSIIFSDNQSKLATCTHDHGPFIANVSLPHKAQNLGKSERWALTLRFFPNEIKSFDEAVSILSPFKRG